jgi:hypothetical protein
LHIGIGIQRGQMTNRKLQVDTLILIPKLQIYVFWYSGQTDRDINPGGLSSLLSSRFISFTYLPNYNVGR